MAQTIQLSPLTRVEGHLDIEVTVDTVNGQMKVVDARTSSPVFRGFEIILVNRDPLDATILTQRVCGVCPVSHAMASTLALEAAFVVRPPTNGRVMRNLVLGANFLQSHILHFYHLAAPDYIDAAQFLAMSPWKPGYSTPDMLRDERAQQLLSHYVSALAMRRKAHQMGAIFGGRLPGPGNFVPGGSTNTVTADAVQRFRTLLDEIRQFISSTYLPDVTAVAAAFPDYANIGRGCGNLLAYGVFDLDTQGTSKLLKRGRYTGGNLLSVDTKLIKEYVSKSWYTADSGNLSPASGVTKPSVGKSGAYSWIKAPRYQDTVHEVGPLARMWVNGDYRSGIGVLHRIAARAQEALKVANAMSTWLGQLQVGGAVYTSKAVPRTGTGIGLTEAPRGALGHWIQITKSKISRYQIVTPTAWNASPRDDRNNLGAIEQALIGTPVADTSRPVEVLRVVHSFDPCLSCAVHMARPGKEAVRVV